MDAYKCQYPPASRWARDDSVVVPNHPRNYWTDQRAVAVDVRDQPADSQADPASTDDGDGVVVTTLSK
jgi:hypothetical protein